MHDLLTAGEELAVEADLLVLVTGMVPRQNDELIATLKLPVGRDGFFNEIHPKLRPVETVVDGILIAGACQSPKTSAESVTSGLAAAAQAAAVLKRGVASLDPQVAEVNGAACDGCGECVPSCPFGAIEMAGGDGHDIAIIAAAGCKGCGACTPVCPTGAIDLQGYTRRAGQGRDHRPPGRECDMTRDIREVVREEPFMRDRLLALLADGPLTVPELAAAAGLPAADGDGLGHGHAQVRVRRRGEGCRPGVRIPLCGGEAAMSTLIAPELAIDIGPRGRAAFDAEACMNCGFCSAACPLGIDLLPRRLFRYVLLGMDEAVRAESEVIFSCLLCRACEQSCPAGVHITENVRLLRGWLLREGR